MDFKESLQHLKVLRELLCETEDWKGKPFDVAEESAREECIFQCCLIVNDFDYIDFDRNAKIRKLSNKGEQ